MSVVIICHDPDVPSKPDDVNKEGRTIPASLPGHILGGAKITGLYSLNRAVKV